MVHGYHWISIDIHVCPRISMDILGHALPLIDIGCPPISMDIYGHPLISIYIRGRGVFGHTVLEREGLRGFCFPVCHPRPHHSPPRGSAVDPQAAWGRGAEPPGSKGCAFKFSISHPKGRCRNARTGPLLVFRLLLPGPGAQRGSWAWGTHYLGGEGPQIFQESVGFLAVPQGSPRLRCRSCGAALMPCGAEGFLQFVYLENGPIVRKVLD
jgi:hypothetical protein